MQENIAAIVMQCLAFKSFADLPQPYAYVGVLTHTKQGVALLSPTFKGPLFFNMGAVAADAVSVT